MSGIEVEVGREGAEGLMLRFRVTGMIDALLLPSPGLAKRADELWRHTCFEAFARRGDEQGYLEFNFSPSHAWAAYRFRGYREGMERAHKFGAPIIALVPHHGVLIAEVHFGHPVLTEKVRLNLAAVIEEKSGAKSYWALAHPPGEPDFHHADCFVLELPAASSP